MKIIKSHIKLSLILTFFAGWYIGLWVENWAFVTMSFEVPAINLLTTAVTLGVTVYVAKIILRKLLVFAEPINEPIKLARIDL